MQEFDRIIIGAGLYGLYAALFCGKKGEHTLVLECEDQPFKRATYINQARVHQGYHYPRSLSTALKSAGYFERFNKDFEFSINQCFDKIYATSSKFSWTNADEFLKFCLAAKIPCRELNPNEYFKKGMCDGAFLTREYTYDATLLKNYYTNELEKYPNVHIHYLEPLKHIFSDYNKYLISTEKGVYKAPFVLNATYASTNQIINHLDLQSFKIKYELCEIILCEVNKELESYGFTVMDGPFFSIMPFGKTNLHSLTSVTFTPHKTSHEQLPTFECQNKSNGLCSPDHLYNCNVCCAKPKTAFPYMSHLAHKYLKDNYQFEYVQSLYSMKPILSAAEIDDSRPTVIKTFTTNPTFVSVLSGKINTVYDLDEVLQ